MGLGTSKYNMQNKKKKAGRNQWLSLEHSGIVKSKVTKVKLHTATPLNIRIVNI